MWQPTISLTCSTFRGGIPRGFLYSVYHQAQGWPPVLPAFCVQPARHAAAWSRGGPFPYLPIWGPAWQACPRRVPFVPFRQTFWWQVSDGALQHTRRENVDERLLCPLNSTFSMPRAVIPLSQRYLRIWSLFVMEIVRLAHKQYI